MKMNFKPVFRQELRNMLLGCAPFFGAMVVITFGSLLLAGRVSSEITFSGYGITAAICLFVFGVVQPRPCLRLCAQLGISRRTAFLGNLAATALTALALAVGGEALLAAGRALGGSNVFFADLYQLFYVNASVEAQVALSFGQHLSSILLNTLLALMCYCGGMFFTYLFWRLNKFWTVVAALAIPVVLNLVPWLIYRNPAAARVAGAFFGWLKASAWDLLLAFVLGAAALCAVCWLLVRRANIKAPTGR